MIHHEFTKEKIKNANNKYSLIITIYSVCLLGIRFELNHVIFVKLFRPIYNVIESLLKQFCNDLVL